MVRGRHKFVWLLAACAVLAAQVAPQAFCGTCDQPCCASRDRDAFAATAETTAQTAEGCPLCAVAFVPSRCDATDQPCRCQMDAREEQPISTATGTSPRFDQADQAVVAVSDRPDVPAMAGVSRDFLAAVLAAPIRPVRILYGVWLN